MPSASVRPLTPSDFSFYGFDSLTESVAETLRAVGIRGGEPAASVVADAVFVPSTRADAADRQAGSFAYRGGLVAADGTPIEAATSRRWGTKRLGGDAEPGRIAPERELDEEVVYLGWLFDHFGHFLLESLARTWALARVDPSTRVVFHSTGQAAPTGTARRILEHFGVPPDRILLPQAPTRLRRVIVPEPLYEMSYAAHERMPQPYREAAARIVGEPRPSPQPVYLSRRLLPSQRRPIIGEEDLEEVMRENGFLVAHPETMEFEDQVRLFNRHADVFASAGSAAHGVLFALGNPNLHLLTAGVPRQDYFLVPKLAGSATTYVNCLGRGDRPVSGNRSPVVAETATVLDYLDQRGFLKRRLRASLARRQPGLRDRYDEAWCYEYVRNAPTRGETLPVEREQEALGLARSSWPLCWVLARYYSRHDPARVDGMVRQFTELAAAEPDLKRLAHYHADVAGLAARIVKACGPETAAGLSAVLADRFLVDPAGGGDRRRDRRLTRRCRQPDSSHRGAR